MQFKVGDKVRVLREEDVPFPDPTEVVYVGDDGMVKVATPEGHIYDNEGDVPGWWVMVEHLALVKRGDDPVDHPKHYNTLGVEAIEHPKHYKIVFRGEEIDAWEIIEAVASDDYHIASVLKYVFRCKKKGNFLQDLKKARQHLARRIELADDQA